jgi:putative phosphoesterase
MRTADELPQAETADAARTGAGDTARPGVGEAARTGAGAAEQAGGAATPVRRAPDARLAVVSDTHGLLPDAVLQACAGADLIVHAGDVGSVEVLEALGRVAPVLAVRGNRDRTGEVAELPQEATAELGGLRFVVAHKRRDLREAHPDPAHEGIRLLLYGHSHRAEIRYRGAAPPGGIPVLWVNPGTVSAPLPWDPRPSMAWVDIRGGEPEARLVFLG